MPEIRALDQVADKWSSVTPMRADEYRKGVLDPRKDWATEAIKAGATYSQAVIKAAQEGRYDGGVKAAGTAKWQKGASEKGPNRFSEGVMLGKDSYEEGFAPFHDVISRVELPAKGAKGDPANYNRVKAIGDALHAKKLAMLK